MKKGMACLLIVLLMLSALGFARAEGEREIRVTGNATVSLAADFATLQIGVTVKKTSMQEAQKTNNEAIQTLLIALYEAGIAEKDIITSRFNIYSGTEYVGTEEKTFYYVDHLLSVTVRDLDGVGRVLDTAIEAGANQTYGITFGSERENEAYRQALAKAVSDAAAKAEVLAGAAGKKLGELTVMDASQHDFSYGLSNTMNAKQDAAAGTAIVTGDVSVSASVVLIYSFE